MATRPKRAKVGFPTWAIRWIEHEDWPTCHADDVGITRRMNQEVLIRLSDDEGPYGEDMLRDTLLHELMHALYFVTGLQQYAIQDRDGDQEEYTIAMLSGGLLGILRMNPAVSAYLLG